MISIQQILQKGITLSINIHFCNFFKFRTYFFPDYYLFNFTYYLSKTFPESRQTAPTFTKYSISVCYSSKYFSRDNFIEIDIYLCKFLFNCFIFTDKMFFFKYFMYYWERGITRNTLNRTDFPEILPISYNSGRYILNGSIRLEFSDVTNTTRRQLEKWRKSKAKFKIDIYTYISNVLYETGKSRTK